MSMQFVIKSLGIVFVLIGVGYLLRPDIAKRLMVFFKKGKRIYLAGLLRFALAIIFLLGAGQCDKKWVIAVLGIIFLLSGLLIFMLGPDKIRRIFDWYDKQPTLLFRFIALIVLAVGAVVVFSA